MSTVNTYFPCPIEEATASVLKGAGEAMPSLASSIGLVNQPGSSHSSKEPDWFPNLSAQILEDLRGSASQVVTDLGGWARLNSEEVTCKPELTFNNNRSACIVVWNFTDKVSDCSLT